MSRGVNKVILVGNLGADPEGRYMDNNTAVCNFNVAVTESWTDRQSGEKKERTEWVRVEMWGKLAEIGLKYLTKGSQVYIEGKMRTDKWTDKDNVERWTTKIRADQMQMLGGGGGSRNERASDRSDQDGLPPRGSTTPPEFDDDIPF